jgi:hypothetical protein
VHHLSIPVETARRQLAARNAAGDEHSHAIDPDARVEDACPIREAPNADVTQPPGDGRHRARDRWRPDEVGDDPSGASGA